MTIAKAAKTARPTTFVRLSAQDSPGGQSKLEMHSCLQRTQPGIALHVAQSHPTHVQSTSCAKLPSMRCFSGSNRNRIRSRKLKRDQILAAEREITRGRDTCFQA